MALLTVRNLSKTYDYRTAVDNIRFQFESGKCVALIRPNGAGKTTTLRMLSGLLKPSGGTISFAGMQPHDDIRKYIGYLPQHPVFYKWMTGEEFLVYVGRLGYLSKQAARQQAEQLIEHVGLKEAANRRIGKYSGGMKQRLGIAQAMIHQPKLLMLDEPVSSLDPFGRREVLNLMEELKKDMTILFSTHILSDADEVSDELLVLHDGKLVESGSMDDLREKYHTAKLELGLERNLEFYRDKVAAIPAVTACYLDHGLLHVTAKI